MRRPPAVFLPAVLPPHGLLSAALLAAALAAGCETTPSTIGAALDDYRAERYTAAHAKAAEAMTSSDGTDRDQAAYLAGVSAYRLGDLDEAAGHLGVAARSRDAALAANAKASLGLVHLAQDHPQDAASLFAEAAPGLEGEDARRAAIHAGSSFARAGNPEASNTWGIIAGRSPEAGAAAFSLQIGAFADRDRAERAAGGTNTASLPGLGDPRIVARPDPRGTLYVVQLGRFRTRSEAARVRAQLGRLEYIVVPAFR